MALPRFLRMPPYPLPLFPLNLVLFPGTPLPLHIFEPRYRQMLADCLIGDRRFGVVQPGGEVEAPDRGAVGCVAEVRGLFARYYELYRLLYDAEPEEPELPQEPVPLSFAISAALECDISLKRRLLAARATQERVGLLVRLIPTLTRVLESALRVHRRAHQNGKGSTHSVLPTES